MSGEGSSQQPNPEMRAVIIANRRLAVGHMLQVIDRLRDGLWLGCASDPSAAFRGTGASVRVVPAQSLACPFRDSIRSAFPLFIVVTGGPGEMSEWPQPGREPDHAPYTDSDGWTL